jgi:hypothetical protein
MKSRFLKIEYIKCKHCKKKYRRYTVCPCLETTKDDNSWDIYRNHKFQSTMFSGSKYEGEL